MALRVQGNAVFDGAGGVVLHLQPVAQGGQVQMSPPRPSEVLRKISEGPVETHPSKVGLTVSLITSFIANTQKTMQLQVGLQGGWSNVAQGQFDQRLRTAKRQRKGTDNSAPQPQLVDTPMQRAQLMLLPPGQKPSAADMIEQHAEGGHYAHEVGSGQSFTERDADVAASVALEEGQNGQGDALVNVDGSLRAAPAKENDSDTSTSDSDEASSITGIVASDSDYLYKDENEDGASQLEGSQDEDLEHAEEKDTDGEATEICYETFSFEGLVKETLESISGSHNYHHLKNLVAEMERRYNQQTSQSDA